MVAVKSDNQICPPTYTPFEYSQSRSKDISKKNITRDDNDGHEYKHRSFGKKLVTLLVKMIPSGPPDQKSNK